jgi:hypothetical protein
MRRHFTLALSFLIAIAGGCVTPPPQLGTTIDMPIETSIQAVKNNPSQYDGKFIMVRGVLDECTSATCDIRQTKPGASPKDSDAPSLSVTFKMGPDMAAAGNSQTMTLSGELANRLYRFSDVTAVGQYAAKCDLGTAPAKPSVDGEREEITVCDDRGFKVARILAVHKRYPATAFGTKDASVMQLPPPAAKNLFTAYIKAITAVNPDSEMSDWKPPYRAYSTGDDLDTAVLCICRGKQCDSAWPTSIVDLVSAPANPYGCVEAAKVNGSWHFAPPSIEY